MRKRDRNRAFALAGFVTFVALFVMHQQKMAALPRIPPPPG